MVASVVALGGCGIGPAPAVYGPPEDFSLESTSEPVPESVPEPVSPEESSDLPEPPVYGPPVDDSLNIDDETVPLAGPGGGDSSSDLGTETNTEIEYILDDETPLYGPPGF